MRDSRPGFGRTLTRALPATALAVAAITGLGGAMHGQLPSGATTDAATSPVPFEVAPVPDAALEEPASVTDTQGQRDAERAKPGVVTASSAKDIPSAALSAYQRAATVINASDSDCRLDWELIAAIARVESDHGRHGGSTLDDNGVAKPAIIGVPLTGRNGTTRIDDTDAGQYDGDQKFDRAVGPLQFIPSTWSMVGVDADGDGQRNPQDIDDASLAAAVYLCSGNDDLSTDAGRRSAVFRYNHSQTYVDVVLDLMAKYVEGSYSADPSRTPVSASIQTREVGTSTTETDEPVTRQARKAQPTVLAAEADILGSGSDDSTADDDKSGNDKPGKSGKNGKQGKGDGADPVDPSGSTGSGETPGEVDDAFDPSAPPEHPSEPTEPAEPTDPPESQDPSDPAEEPETPSEPATPSEPGETETTEPTAPTPDPTTELEVCPVLDPETGAVVDPVTGEVVLDDETGEPLTADDLEALVNVLGQSCASPADPVS